jgi:hypothetical protein
LCYLTEESAKLEREIGAGNSDKRCKLVSSLAAVKFFIGISLGGWRTAEPQVEFAFGKGWGFFLDLLRLASIYDLISRKGTVSAPVPFYR